MFFGDDDYPFPKLTHHTSGTTDSPNLALWRKSKYQNAIALREARVTNVGGIHWLFIKQDALLVPQDDPVDTATAIR